MTAQWVNVLDQFAAGWEGLDDPRTGNAALHDFHELLMIALCTLLCGGQGAVDMLKMLSLKGTIVTADALNCQRAIAQQIVDQGGDYCLALKGNQGTLHDDVRTFLDDPLTTTTTTAKPTVDGDHGRIETRTATISTDLDWLQGNHQWPGLKARTTSPPFGTWFST